MRLVIVHLSEGEDFGLYQGSDLLARGTLLHCLAVRAGDEPCLPPLPKYSRELTRAIA